MDDLAAGSSPFHCFHPLAKLLVTVLYILVTVSFDKYDFSGLLVMLLYPVMGYALSGIPVRTCFYKLRIVLPLVCAVGLLNPFLDRQIVFSLGGVMISGGVVSMITLMLKGVFCLMASFLLIATTTIEELCRALRRIHTPRLLTSLLLLTYRYISVLLEEVAVMTEAYHLRAPGQRGIHISAWGSFLGQLMLRSLDRADALYDSMLLRGFNGEFHYAAGKRAYSGSALYAAASAAFIISARIWNLPALLGAIIS